MSFWTNVFEHGILSIDDEWNGRLSRIATTGLPAHGPHTVSFLNDSNESLHHVIHSMTRVNGPHRQDAYLEESQVAHSLSLLLWRLNYLLGRYTAITRRMQKRNSNDVTSRPVTLSMSVAFDFDSYAHAALNTYRAFASVLSKHYDEPALPTEIHFAPSRMTHAIPVAMRQLLDRSWNEQAAKLRRYSCCLVNYEALSTERKWCVASRFGKRWGLSLKLPADPFRTSRELDFEHGPDALSFAWSNACHIVDLGRQVMSDVRIRMHLDRPDEGVGRSPAKLRTSGS
jgi:hypothetical protein